MERGCAMQGWGYVSVLGVCIDIYGQRQCDMKPDVHVYRRSEID